MTDWEKQLKRRRGNIRRQELALDDDIVAAHADGLSWRTIGAAAEVNHEWARQASDRIAKRQADSEIEGDQLPDPFGPPEMPAL